MGRPVRVGWLCQAALTAGSSRASSFPEGWASPFCPMGLQSCLEAEPDLRQMAQEQKPDYSSLRTGPFLSKGPGWAAVCESYPLKAAPGFQGPASPVALQRIMGKESLEVLCPT